MNYDEVMKKLEALASHDPKDLAGMARFGINVDKAWVVSIPKLRTLTKEILKSEDIKKHPAARHELALELWESGIHEARLLAGFIDEPKQVTLTQMEKWVSDFDSWDITDQVCGNLFDHSRYAVQKAIEWSSRKEEFVKRSGFVLMCGLAVHDKQMTDDVFLQFLTIIKRESGDDRNFVRKAVNWALRTIGKSRNKFLYDRAIETASEILELSQNSTDWGTKERKAARWIASDTMRELQKSYITKRFK